MSREDMIRKLTSRKFWLAVAAFVTELIIAFKGDADLAETLSGMIMAGATVIAYIVGEGLVDSESAGAAENQRR
ncbi:MAG: hypothetical protein IJG40_16610 [Oscillospiraceae bacterium]|nr:hypothetical protein [Oscillospiraceae bacterium]